MDNLWIYETSQNIIEHHRISRSELGTPQQGCCGGTDKVDGIPEVNVRTDSFDKHSHEGFVLGIIGQCPNS